MIAGKLKHYVLFERLVEEQDSDGATVESWQDAFGRKIPTEFIPSKGREFIAADAVQSVSTGQMRVRYKPEFKAKMRAFYRGQYYDITSLVPDKQSMNRDLILIYTTGANEG